MNLIEKSKYFSCDIQFCIYLLIVIKTKYQMYIFGHTQYLEPLESQQVVCSNVSILIKTKHQLSIIGHKLYLETTRISTGSMHTCK